MKTTNHALHLAMHGLSQTPDDFFTYFILGVRLIYSANPRSR